MKRLLTAAAVLMCLTALPTFALDAPDRDSRTTDRRDRTTVIDDVIRMTQAGVSDDAIIKFLHESKDSYVVDADVVIALTDAHVSKNVINAVMDEAYSRDDDRRDNGRRTTVYVRPSYAYDPWIYPYYDPFWYGPRLSVGFGFGYYGGYRGGYRGHIGGGFGGGHHGRH